VSPAPFRFCPRCGNDGCLYHDRKYWRCEACGFTYYHNVASSASVILETEGGLLTIVRAKEPRAGYLSFPGGFVDPDERAEDAAIRECREEIGLDVAVPLRFVGSWPNDYAYGDVLYKTCDLYFSARLPPRPNQARGGDASGGFRLDPGEASSLRVVPFEALADAPFAFESARRAALAWLDMRRIESTQ